jgi:hypothetical protein
MNIDDIAGSKPRVDPRKPEKDIMNISDILGASNRVPYQRKSAYSNIDYRDITAKVWESKRYTNPLRPEYKVRDTITEGD